MTDEPNSISRRNVLAGLGTIGVGGALAGAGTSAFFSDSEHFEGNELVAGELDLKLDWQQLYYGMPNGHEQAPYGEAGRPFVNAYPDHNGDGEQSIDVDETVYRYSELGKGDELGRNIGDDEIDYCDLDQDFDQDPLIELDDVKPGDCGEITFSLHLCDNPGWVWFRSLDIEYGDGRDDEAHLADEATAKLWYDRKGNNEFDEDKDTIIKEGRLSDVLDALNDGILLNGRYTSLRGGSVEAEGLGTNKNSVEWEGQGSEHATQNCPNEVGYWKWVLTPGGGEIVVGDGEPELEVEFEDGEKETVTGYRPGRGSGAVHFDVTKEGGGTVVDATAEFTGGGKNSRLTISEGRCEPDEDEIKRCLENSTTQFIALKWCLPEDVGNKVQGDSVKFDLQFYTEQCRHNEDPEPDWPNYDD